MGFPSFVTTSKDKVDDGFKIAISAMDTGEIMQFDCCDGNFSNPSPCFVILNNVRFSELLGQSWSLENIQLVGTIIFKFLCYLSGAEFHRASSARRVAR